MKLYHTITKEQLGINSPIKLEIAGSEQDIYNHMANDMTERIEYNNSINKATVFIVPVGPIGQYRIFTDIVNRKRISLKNVFFINMDEYLNDDDTYIEYSHPLSFRRFMDNECYNQLDDDLIMPDSNRIFPTLDNKEKIQEIIEQYGLDTSYGGIGINGHIAFNEPEDNMSIEEFMSLETRVLSLTKETRTINSVTAAGGYIDYIPRRCVTVGMKEILSANRIRFYLNREWQKGIVRKILHGDVSAQTPATAFQLHNDAKLIIADYVAEQPLGRLR